MNCSYCGDEYDPIEGSSATETEGYCSYECEDEASELAEYSL